MDRKKELKLNYKLNPPPMGVFQLKNNVNGKIFIGSTGNLKAIMNRFRALLGAGPYVHKELQEDWKKYGESSFTFEVLEELKPLDDPAFDYKEDLKVLEEIWLEKLQPYGDKGYNKKKNR